MKLKRLLTGVLSAVMALSVCAMPAAAAEPTAAAAPKTGNLTITKYEVATGKTSAEYENKRGDPLAGVTFTVYKVAEVNQTVDTNGNVSLRYDLVDGLKDQITIDWESCLATDKKQYDSARLFEAFNTALTANDKKLSDWHLTSVSQPTNEQGVAEFKNLATGVYMVEETSAPAQITIANRTANFMVSIPMTVTKEDGTQEITYNVKAEPKNVSTYGGVTLNKYGQVAGDNKIKARIADAVFQLYRDNGTEDVSNWKPVDLTAKGIKVDGKLVTDANAKIGEVTTTTTGVNITGLTPGNYYFKEISAPAGYIADTKTEHKFELDANGDVLVDNKKVDSGVVDVVNEKPDFEKVVTKRDGTKDNHDADYGIGDKVPYTLTIKVPENVADLQTFKITDTTLATQLVQDKTSVKVTGKDKNNNDVKFESTDSKQGYAVDVLTDKKGYSVMTIDFNPKQYKTALEAVAGGTITVEYKAELKSGAVIADKGNLNTADLIYSRTTDTTVDETAKGNEPYQIEDKSVVYTFEVNIKKTGGSTTGEALNGVTFDLYKKVEEGTDKASVDGTKYSFSGTDYAFITSDAATALGLDGTAKWINVKTLTTGKDGTDGTDKVSGLPAGEYKLVETKTVDGYNLLSEPVDAKLNLEYETSWENKQEYDANGKLIRNDYKSTKYNYKGEANTTVTPGSTLTIVNRKGFTLPVTGGFGTLLFSGIGVLLVLAGVCVLFSMKKKNNRT